MAKWKDPLKYLALILLVFGGVYLFKGPDFPYRFKVIDKSSSVLFKKDLNASGVILVNVDQDDEEEILITASGSNLILKRNGPNFIEVKIPELEDSQGHTQSVTSCDLNQDGREEILLLNIPHATKPFSISRILRFEQGKWIDILSPRSSIAESLKNGYAATCIDRKGNGQYGLVISKDQGPISYLEMEEGKLKDIARQIGLNYSPKGRSITGIPGPSGRTNLFFGNIDSNLYFVNQGNGTFKESALEAGITDNDFETRGSSIIDINHDDIPDLVYGNHFGPLRLLKQNRTGKFEDVTPDSLIINYAVNATVVGDFNLDGYEDIYLNNIQGENKLYARYEDQWFNIGLNDLSEKELSGVSTLAADLDQNGSYEILNTHGDGNSAPISLYSIVSESNWVKLRVQYTNGTIPRGASIKLRTSLRDQIKVIATGSGRFANYSRDLLFGLLPDEKILAAEVILPSGEKIEVFKGLKFKQLNTIEIENKRTRSRVSLRD